MADSSGRDLFPTEEAARRIIDAVGIELPASRRYVGWLADFQNDLSKVLKAGWYASLGMIDPSADEERQRLRQSLAEKGEVQASDRSLRRLPDSHIRELVDAAGWFFSEWWDRPFATSQAGETKSRKPRASGPAVRFLREVATQLADAIECDVLPSSWLRASSDPVARRIGRQWRQVAERPDKARNAIRASRPYQLVGRLRVYLEAGPEPSSGHAANEAVAGDD
ncbi:hypothetical protein K2X89_02340 [Myxococcota bacterium]|nr:hypothetical protein [Myxococcota bacterium]